MGPTTTTPRLRCKPYKHIFVRIGGAYFQESEGIVHLQYHGQLGPIPRLLRPQRYSFSQARDAGSGLLHPCIRRRFRLGPRHQVITQAHPPQLYDQSLDPHWIRPHCCVGGPDPRLDQEAQQGWTQLGREFCVRWEVEPATGSHRGSPSKPSRLSVWLWLVVGQSSIQRNKPQQLRC
jgi:hypothetical protein